MRGLGTKSINFFIGIVVLIGSLLWGIVCLSAAPATVYADTTPVVVVLDPGHGGSNEGGVYGDFTEKDLTLKVALAMKTELEKYENITVYLTRTSDVDMSLEERVDYAESVGADFFFCLHFNMSAEHTLYGAECWVSAYGDCYAKGYDFATIENDMLTGLGLYDRGIKTRISSSGDSDYYGVIRRATAIGMPSVIIEHCHLDNAMDDPFIDSDSWPERYGVLDATAVAEYFGLKSEELGVDYGGVIYSTAETPASTVLPDTTAPDACTVTGAVIDRETGTIRVDLSAYDSQSRMLYYTWTTDNGATFADLRPWPEDTASFTFEIPLPEDGEGSFFVRAFNLYDLAADSAVIDIAELEVEEPAAETFAMAKAETDPEPETARNAPGKGAWIWLLFIVLAIVCILNAAVLFSAAKGRISKKKSRSLFAAVSIAGFLAMALMVLVGRNSGAEDHGRDMEEPDSSEDFSEPLSEETAEYGTEGAKGTQIAGEEFMEQNFYYTELSEEIKNRITGISYPETEEELLISYEDLAYVHVIHYDFDGQVQEGELICNKTIAEDLVEIFKELYLAEYPIEEIALVDEYNGDDEASMAANNSSCFNYRVISGTTKISNHAYGLAIDINPLYNPYITGTGENVKVQPANAADYTDREGAFLYKIDHDDLCYQLFIEHGFTWGGDWTSSKDYQHFEKTEF